MIITSDLIEELTLVPEAKLVMAIEAICAADDRMDNRAMIAALVEDCRLRKAGIVPPQPSDCPWGFEAPASAAKAAE